MTDTLFPRSIVCIAMTMTDDVAHPIVNEDIPFYDVNIFCYTNACKHGQAGVLDAIIYPNDVAYYTKGNLRDFLFINETAGSNAKIVVVATVPNKFVKRELGI